jgi:hypothetical protein
VQAPPEVKKLLPVTVMMFPIPEEVGVRAISGTTVNVVVAQSSPGKAVTLRVAVPALLFTVCTTNEPVTAPPETEQVELRIVLAGVALMVQDASPVLNPEPETLIVFPPLPLVGDAVMLNALTPTENGAVADGPTFSASATVTI